MSEHVEPIPCDIRKSDKSTDEMSESEENTAVKSENPTSVLKQMSDMGHVMRLMEIIEDGSKIQIVVEDVSPRDAEAVHRFQLAQGRGRLTVSDDGISFEGRCPSSQTPGT